MCHTWRMRVGRLQGLKALSKCYAIAFVSFARPKIERCLGNAQSRDRDLSKPYLSQESIDRDARANLQFDLQHQGKLTR